MINSYDWLGKSSGDNTAPLILSYIYCITDENSKEREGIKKIIFGKGDFGIAEEAKKQIIKHLETPGVMIRQEQVEESEQFKNFVKDMPDDLLLLSQKAIGRRLEANRPKADDPLHVLEEIKTALETEI